MCWLQIPSPDSLRSTRKKNYQLRKHESQLFSPSVYRVSHGYCTHHRCVTLVNIDWTFNMDSNRHIRNFLKSYKILSRWKFSLGLISISHRARERYELAKIKTSLGKSHHTQRWQPVRIASWLPLPIREQEIGTGHTPFCQRLSFTSFPTEVTVDQDTWPSSSHPKSPLGEQFLSKQCLKINFIIVPKTY